MLAKDPNNRYATPEALLRDLQPSPGGAEAGRRSHATDEEDEERDTTKRRKRAGGKHRSRDSDDTREVRSAKTLPFFKRYEPRWVWAGGTVAVVAAIAGIAWLASGSRKQPPPDQNTPVAVIMPGADSRGDTSRRLTSEPKKIEPEPKKIEPEPKKIEPEPKAELPRLYTPLVAINAGQLRDEIEKSWQGRAAPPLNPVVYRVSRLDQGGDGRYFPSLAAACEKAPAGRETIIEIHDNGPVFEAPAAVTGRSLRIRAGKGYRPLLAWDLQLPEAAKVNQFLAVRQGELALEDLDVVLKCAGPGTKRAVAAGAGHGRDAVGQGLQLLRGGYAACRRGGDAGRGDGAGPVQELPVPAGPLHDSRLGNRGPRSPGDRGGGAAERLFGDRGQPTPAGSHGTQPTVANGLDGGPVHADRGTNLAARRVGWRDRRSRRRRYAAWVGMRCWHGAARRRAGKWLSCATVRAPRRWNGGRPTVCMRVGRRCWRPATRSGRT